MVVHQTVGMTEPVVALIDLMENLQKGESVWIIPENGFPAIASRGHMVNRSGKFDPQRSRHKPTLPPSLENSTSKDLTPLTFRSLYYLRLIRSFVNLSGFPQPSNPFM